MLPHLPASLVYEYRGGRSSSTDLIIAKTHSIVVIFIGYKDGVSIDLAKLMLVKGTFVVIMGNI